MLCKCWRLQLQIWYWDVSVVPYGEFENFSDAASVPAFIVKRVFEYYLPGMKHRASMNTVLLRRKNNVLLIDTGLGPGAAQPGAPPTGLRLSRLCSLGVEPEQVTGVLITHAHADHTGGLVGADGNATFPNSCVYIGRIEDEFWRQPVESIIERAPQLPVAFVVNGSLTAYAAVVKAYPGQIQKLDHRWDTSFAETWSHTRP